MRPVPRPAPPMVPPLLYGGPYEKSQPTNLVGSYMCRPGSEHTPDPQHVGDPREGRVLGGRRGVRRENGSIRGTKNSRSPLRKSILSASPYWKGREQRKSCRGKVSIRGCRGSSWGRTVTPPLCVVVDRSTRSTVLGVVQDTGHCGGGRWSPWKRTHVINRWIEDRPREPKTYSVPLKERGKVGTVFYPV